VLFVGNLSYGPNMTAVRYFIEQVLPHIQAQRPFVEFVICGPNSETMAQEYRTRSGVRFYGFVDDLTSMYLSARVQVVPVSFASGIQTKLIESMAVGLPAVVSPQSAKANGVTHDRQVLVADSRQAFVNAVLQVLDDTTLASQLSTQGRAFVREHFTLEHQRPLIAELLAH
jgi:glycosyltransferase involved in cell wall biosynthesis